MNCFKKSKSLILPGLIAISVLMQNEIAFALSCENLFQAQYDQQTESLKSRSYDQDESLIKDPQLFSKVFAGQLQVPSDVLLIHLEHFQNYKIRKVEFSSLVRVNIANAEENVTVKLVSDSQFQPLPSWLFVNNTATVNYFLHPTNTAQNIPFYRDYDRHLAGPYAVSSASRSVFVRDGGNYYSIKMGTNYPEGKDKEPNLKKMNGIQQEIIYGMNHTETLLQLEKRFSKGRKFSIVYERASVTPQTNIVGRYGMMVRDLSFLKKKNRYYLPAFSIPYIGEAIAKKFGRTFDEFWGEKFAQALAEAEAELFFKFGALMNWPHGQNILIETDLQFKPTGKIIIRDVDDLVFYTPAAQHLLSEDHYYGVAHVSEIDFKWSRTQIILIPPPEQDQPSPEKLALAKQWQIQHERALRKAFAKTLEIRDFMDESIKLEILFKKFKNDIEAYFELKAAETSP